MPALRSFIRKIFARGSAVLIPSLRNSELLRAREEIMLFGKLFRRDTLVHGSGGGGGSLGRNMLVF